jgi:translation initiation factor IF-2
LAVRIYTLAKELNYDSKALVDVCAAAGVLGKGSALAGLTDEEVATVRAFVKGGGRAGAADAKPAAKPKPGGMPIAQPVDDTALRREDYIPPGGAAGKPKSLDAPAEPVEPKRSSPADGPQSKPVAAVRLAAMPAAEAPPPEVVAGEPAPQKPDLKLPPDAIRASKSGARPLADRLRKHEADVAKAKAPPAKLAPQPPSGSPDREADRGGKGRTRRGKAGAGKEGEKKVDFASSLGGRAQRQLRRKRPGGRDSQGGTGRPRRGRPRMRRSGISTAAPRKNLVTLELPCTVRAFSEAVGVPARQVLMTLLSLSEGSMPSITSNLDHATAELVADELGVQIELREQVTLEDRVLTAIDEQEDAAESLVTRPPIITFLGHVDHGKTSLLDRIIGIDVVSGESGGITQHIRAYNIHRDEGRIAFVDTPGHEAFTEMRARGANVTDIAVLVVAAEDGVMPQTEEAISHARAADVPIVVALNKIDLPNADPDRVMQQLAAAELLPTEWGGDIEVVKTSAETGEGISELFETVLTIAELHDYKANPNRPALGTCLESEQEGGRGVIAKVVVQNGTLRVGDTVVCGGSAGRIRAMYDTLDVTKPVEEAGPSTPVNIVGLDIAPEAGERFYVLEDIAQARQIAETRQEQQRQSNLGGVTPHVTLDNLFERLGTGEVQTVNLILRADVRGSIEAIKKELTKLEHPEIQLKLLQATVGGITEADVYLADASDAVILGFNVVPEEGARILADRLGVDVRRYQIIYKLTDELRDSLEGRLAPEKREVDLGRALVQAKFTISKIGTVAGCRVLQGTIERNTRVRIIRDNTIIGDYPMDTLRREKDDVKSVREGMECGIKLSGFNDIKEGDVLEVYKIEEVRRKFDD